MTSTESSVRLDVCMCGGVGWDRGWKGLRGSPWIHRADLGKRRGQALLQLVTGEGRLFK